MGCFVLFWLCGYLFDDCWYLYVDWYYWVWWLVWLGVGDFFLDVGYYWDCYEVGFFLLLVVGWFFFLFWYGLVWYCCCMVVDLEFLFECVDFVFCWWCNLYSWDNFLLFWLFVLFVSYLVYVCVGCGGYLLCGSFYGCFYCCLIGMLIWGISFFKVWECLLFVGFCFGEVFGVVFKICIEFFDWWLKFWCICVIGNVGFDYGIVNVVRILIML